MVKYRASKQAKDDAYLATLAVIKSDGWSVDDDRYFVFRHFFPPDDKRRRDEDNMVASCKAYQDGVFAAMEIDDSRIAMSINSIGRPCEGGRVEFWIRPLTSKWDQFLRELQGDDQVFRSG